ncbi:hypothetical protein LSH36_791g00032 [Paralvinella palmiformis]|uniref:Exocyst complex component Sec8 n=1 Tax=Paralvinella palmiformis TaxID=53620 RepID=A0AAD9J159_9ANNE|nr:hypothetical protein LSH36_791g00032 [Paralvinella palmiformis]
MATASQDSEMENTEKNLQETKGMLMSIIRTLSASVDVTQREKEKVRLEKLYKESDKKLDTLIEENYQDLTSIIQAFSRISAQVSASQERIRAIKDNLQSCKNLMHCKRDELRKLWIDGIEYKTVVDLLDQIEQVKDITDILQSYIDKKQFLHSSDLLLKSVSMVDGDLSDIESLAEIRTELHTKKDEMYDMLIDELHKQIYVKSTASIMKSFQRQGSLRQSQRGDKISYLKLAMKQAAHQVEADTAAEEALRCLQKVKLEDISAPQQITEDLNVDPERDPVQYIAILVESLATLHRMPEAIDALRSRIKPGLLAIVQRAAQQVSDTYYLEGEDMPQMDQPQYLLELLELIFKQFKIVAGVHLIILANMQRIKNSMSTLGDFCLYDAVEVWTKIQEVLCHVLRDYLDTHSSTNTPGGSSGTYTEAATDINLYFSKKRPTRSKKNYLFRFDSSSHAISMSSYLREQRQEVYGTDDMTDVAGTMTDLGQFPLVCKPCAENITLIYKPLQKFLREIESAVRGPSGSLMLQKFLNKFIREVYLEQVIEKIETNISLATKAYTGSGYEQQRVTVDLRMQRELGVAKPLLKSTVLVAQSIQELCELMYVLPDYADQFLSMIVKILQEYRLVTNNTYKNIVSHETEDRRTISATWAKDEDINRLLRSLPNWSNLKENAISSHQMTERDLRVMNSKESSILTNNLATLDEWFSHHVLDLTSSLGANNQQILFTNMDTTNVDLTKDLSMLEDVLHHSLQNPKFRCRNIFALQQCLTGITMSRETDLDRTRQYYELLYLTPEDFDGYRIMTDVINLKTSVSDLYY